MDDIKAKQRLELKELQARIQSMKHSVPKGDKKRKKQVMAEIAILEAEMEKKHSSEIENFEKETHGNEKSDELCDALGDTTISVDQTATQKISKAQKRRERKEEEERKRQQRLNEAEIENKNSTRNLESIRLKEIVSQQGLQVKEIAPDGNCLYSAIADQLSSLEIKYEWKTLRTMTAEQLKSNKEEFIPFMTNSDTGEPLTEDEYEKYCYEVKETNTWGGQIEIQALSSALGLPIEIFQADSPVLKVGDNFEGQVIRLSYHKHAYGLGEHYNSVIPTEE